MQVALSEARRGDGQVSPNPMVGVALIDRQGRLHRSHHARFGGPHAEARLLARAGQRARGATLFVTLEPCCYRGKTPPCVEAILESGVDRVVVAALDPNPRVAGRGLDALRSAGIRVELGLAEQEALELNLPYYLSQAAGRAFLHLKIAASLDGKIATDRGASRWITGPEARTHVHRERGRSDAVMVGSGTVLADDPRLTVRHVDEPQPSRIVVDSKLRTPLRPALWRAGPTAPAGDGRRLGNFREEKGSGAWSYPRVPRIILATRKGGKRSRLEKYRGLGWEVWELAAGRDGRVSLRALARRAAAEGLLRLYVEAGPGLTAGLLRSRLVDELSLYQAPILLGGRGGWTGFYVAATLAGAWRLRPLERRELGEDLLLRYRRRNLIEEITRYVHGIDRGEGPRRGGG